MEKVKALNQSGLTWPVSDWLIAQLQRSTCRTFIASLKTELRSEIRQL